MIAHADALSTARDNLYYRDCLGLSPNRFIEDQHGVRQAEDCLIFWENLRIAL